MTKSELVEKLKKEMPEFTGTDEEKEIKTALYIYVELGKMKSFDERYYFGNSKMIRQAEREALLDKTDPNKIAKKKKIICITMTHLYKAILDDFGIESQTITEMTERNTINHMTNILNLKSGKRIMADAQLDMHRIQTGLSLKFFGCKSEYDTDVISDEKLTDMLVEIGYIRSKDDYRDEKIKKIKNKIEGLDLNEAVRTILNSPEIYEVNENLGEVEAFKYYYNILKMLKPDELGKNLFQFKCSKKIEGQEQPEYSFGIYSNAKDIEDLQIYLYSKKKRRLLECDLNKLAELEDNGLQIGRNKVGKATRQLYKFIKIRKRERKEKVSGDEAR